MFFTSVFLASFSAVTAGLLDEITTSPKNLIKNLNDYFSKDIKIKMKLIYQGIINSLPYSSINLTINGIVLKPY